MGKNNKKNQNKKQNTNRVNHSTNTVSTQQKTKQPKVNPNEVKAPLYLPADLADTIREQILGVLAGCKFNKISIPLGTYRYLVDNTVGEDDNRITTIGYVRRYDAESQEFSVVIFNNFIDLIKSNEHNAIELVFSTYNENLGTILKFNIIPVEYADEVDEQEDETDKCDEAVETVEEDPAQETEE